MHRGPVSLLAGFVIAGCTAAPVVRVPIADGGPGEAAEYYASKRAGSGDPQASYAKARVQMRRMVRYATESDAFATRGVIANGDEGDEPPFERWTYLGPGNIGGRTRTLVIDPRAPDTMYAGGVSGGVWKTIDGGERWEPVGDAMANLAVTALAMHPGDPKTLYAGTGEGFFREEQRGTGLPLRGNGIYVTHDGGGSWSRLDSTSSSDFHWVNDLAISGHNGSRLYAATRSGVWRSTDGGAQWTRVLATTVKGGCLDLASRGDTDGDYFFASCGTFEQATVYRNTNAEGEGAWVPVLAAPQMGRTSIAIAPSDPTVVYALSASNEPGDFNQGLLAVYRSAQSGDAGTWETRITNRDSDRTAAMLLSNPLYGTLSICRSSNATNVFITMGWYCNTIAVDPVNPNRIWAGGVDLFRSDDGGRSWGVASYWWAPEVRASFLHADQHSIQFHPRYDGVSNRTMFITNDGGVFRSLDTLAEPSRGLQAACGTRSALRFTNLNHNYGVTQFYHGAVYPDGRTFIGGTQDNGTLRGNLETGTDGWVRIAGGDGGYVAIDPNDPNVIYAESQEGWFMRSLDGGAHFFTVTEGVEDSFLFITPFALDPNVSNRLWLGGTRLWRTDDRGDHWSAASPPLRGKVSAIAIAQARSRRVVAGTNEGDIVQSDGATLANGATQWSAAHPRDGFVSSLAFDPTNPDVVFATYAGFGGTHVWMSIDGGLTWSPRDGSADGALPDIPAHSIAIDPTRPNRLYLGTDLGVFVSTDRGARWAVENTGFASVVTEAVVIAQGARGPAVYAFTHGRGAWRAELVFAGPRRRGVRK